jgi:phosphoribosylamine--glycine ligase
LNVLIIGSGGREHALAWKAAQSPLTARLWIAPGNAGTASLGCAGGNVNLSAEDVAGLLDFAYSNRVDLTIVGPEVPLGLGLVDAFRAQRLAAFGPAQAAAQLETSKAFAKSFMARHGIPTPRYEAFADFDVALEYVRAARHPVVLKASGLAAGKGVYLPADPGEAEAGLRHMMVDGAFGAAGRTVIIEERLSGPELSVLAFSDGEHVALMPAAQDHKRAFDGDAGPNTGGMGALAPAAVADAALLEDIRQRILQPAIDGMRAEGTPYVGVLYAGLMLTDAGPQVLEFNCRFGDPEAQAILPLLESDLIEVCRACLAGRLQQTSVRWKAGAAVSVVLASEGYPGAYPKGRPIYGLERAAALADTLVFHAGTRLSGTQTVTAGGRVLNVVGLGADLSQARRRAYAGAEQIQFDGRHYRRDIAAGA